MRDPAVLALYALHLSAAELAAVLAGLPSTASPRF